MVNHPPYPEEGIYTNNELNASLIFSREEIILEYTDGTKETLKIQDGVIISDGACNGWMFAWEHSDVITLKNSTIKHPGYRFVQDP